jgi:hypothetical protein
MAASDHDLKRYLEMEALLNAFFAAFGYCAATCIPDELPKSGNRSVAGCCTQRYYARYDLDHPAFERLRQAREALYGTPAEQVRDHSVSPCEYHDPRRGCRLATHKSPTCLGFLCREAIDCLRREHGIHAYDYAGVSGALEWILTGDFTDGQYGEFREAILAMTRRLTPSTGAGPPGCRACGG